MRLTRVGLISVLLAIAASLGFATGRLTGKSRPSPVPARSPALDFTRRASTPLEALFAKKIAACEAYAVALLLEYHAVQHGFACADHYGTGRYVYANPVDGSGFADLHFIEVDGKKLGYIGADFARASYDTPFERTGPNSMSATDVHGYYFRDITGDAEGAFDYTREYALCAAPACYQRAGVHMYVISHEGRIFRRDPRLEKCARAVPISTWPSDEELARDWEEVLVAPPAAVENDEAMFDVPSVEHRESDEPKPHGND
ncbi:MAG: DUF2950 family protein [Planctomycetota bacterium]